MFTYLLSFLLLRRFGLPRPLRYLILIFLACLAFVAFAYTVNLFLTLPERTSGHHVQHHSSH